VDVRIVRAGKWEVAAKGLRSLLALRPHGVFRYDLRRVRAFVSREIEEFAPDVLWGFQLPSCPFFPLAGPARIVLDLVDSASRYVSEHVGSPGIPFRAKVDSLLQFRLREIERRAIEASSAVLVNSALDVAHLRRATGDERKVIQLDNCVPSALLNESWHAAGVRRPHTILIVGNMAYTPNFYGAVEYATRAFPVVREQISDAELWICGARSDSLARTLRSSAGVRVLGFVDDLVPLYKSASAVVVPVPYAGGTPYKLLEALAIGVPTIVSPATSEVCRVAHEREVLVADSPAAFARLTLSAIEDDALAASLSAAGRRFIEQRHTWESKRELIVSLVRNEAGSPGR
jgi:glycosyltransferase involved in cell wall biosynthesis